MTFSQNILHFISTLTFDVPLSPGIDVMHPFENPATIDLCKTFYERYYHDGNKRWMIIGINPGRFGGGVTGIPFTDPIRLEKDCGIENSWPKKQELSSVFIYQMIKAFGGPTAFYKQFYITAISPLGFTRNNKNLNYYDDKSLMSDIKGFAVDCLRRQLNFGIEKNAVFCLGEGKNFHYLSRLNEEYGFFEEVVPLSHPRFIMQYRLRKMEDYIRSYLEKFQMFCRPDGAGPEQ
jgi:hypothetical protein